MNDRNHRSKGLGADPGGSSQPVKLSVTVQRSLVCITESFLARDSRIPRILKIF